VNHTVTVRHPERTDKRPEGTPYSEMWVGICTCGWFTSYFEPSEYTRLREKCDEHEKLYSLPANVRSDVMQHAFTTVNGTDVDGKTVEAHGRCGALGCGWVGPKHRGEGCHEKANVDCSAHYAAQIAKATS